MVTRARYSEGPRRGLIRLTKSKGDKAISYSLQLYHVKNGFIKTNKVEFKIVSQAIGHASLYGFNSSVWELEEK